MIEPSNRQRDQGAEKAVKMINGLNLYSYVPSWQKIFLFIPVIPFLLLISYCAPGSCFEETNAFLKVAFYKSATGKKVAPDSLTLYGLNMETNKLYNKSVNVQPALLPLNAGTDNCAYIIRINGKTDTMHISYSSFPHLISKECGYAFYHTLDTPTVTNHAIISFRLENRNITTINEENLRLYY